MMATAVFSAREKAHSKRRRRIFWQEPLLCFLVSRAVLFGNPLPLGAAAAVTATGSKNERWICLAASMAGYLSASLHPRYPIALALLAAVAWIDDGLFFRAPSVTGLTVAASILLSDLYFQIRDGVSIASAELLLLCMCGGFGAATAFSCAFPLVKNHARRYLQQKDLTALLILFCTAARGIPLLQNGWINLNDTVCIFFVLLLARSQVSGAAAGAGVITAFLMGADGAALFPRIGLFAFVGALAGIFRFLGKGGVIGGALLGGMLAALSLGKLGGYAVCVLDFPVAALLFLLFPDQWLDQLGVYRIRADRSESEARMKESLCGRLKSVSEAFLQLSSTVFALSAPPQPKTDRSAPLAKIEERVCKGCPSEAVCRRKETGDEAERLVYHCFAVMEQKGRVEESDLPVYFRKQCLRLPQYLYEVTNLYELYKNELFWQGKLDRATAFTIRQLEDVSEVIDRFSEQLDQNISFYEELAFSVACALDRHGYAPKNVEVTGNAGGRYEVRAEVESCRMAGGCKEIARLLSELLERPMEKVEGDCRLHRCKLAFCEATPYRAVHAIAAACKEGEHVSGDTAAALTLPDGNLLLLLSDGKGSGNAAHLQSSETVRLLCKLLYAGFSPTSAVRLANSVLGQQPDEEGFATVDLTLLDLSQAKADLIKSGACATYIRRQNLVKRVESRSLPAGILDEADIELTTEELHAGDWLIMLSDGVTDAFPNEKMMKNEINRLSRTQSPRHFASALLARAKQCRRRESSDDMTVIVSKLIEK